MDDDFWNKVSGISDDGDDDETFSEPSFSDDPEDADAGGEEPYFPRESPMRRRRYAERAGYGEDEPYRPRYYSEEAPQSSATPQPQQAPQPMAEPAPVVDQSQPNEPGKVIAWGLGVIAVCALLTTGLVAVKNHQAAQDAAPSVVVTECASPTTQAPTPTPKPVETTPTPTVTQSATPSVSTSPQPASPTDRASIDPDSLQFSEPKTVTGLVVSKSIMETGGNLMFTVHLSVPDSNRPTINYVVPKGQYDGYKSGDLIEVTYRVDQNGNIAIIR